MRFTFGPPKRVEGAPRDALRDLQEHDLIARRARSHVLGRHEELRRERRLRSETILARHWRRFWAGSLLERAVLVSGIAMVFGLAPVAVDALIDTPLLDDEQPAIEHQAPLESEVGYMVKTPSP